MEILHQTTQLFKEQTQSEIIKFQTSKQITEEQLNQICYFRKTSPCTKKKIRVNTSHSRGQIKLLKFLCKKNDWLQVFKEGTIMWSGLAIPNQQISLATEMIVNRIPAMPHICHKKTMGFILNKFRQYWPGEYEFYPKTYLLPEDYEKLENKINKGGVFIAKPSAGCQGDGIILITKMSQIPKLGSNEWIVQPYIDKPLLLENKKFDFRLYVLIASVQPYICYLNEQGLARFCTEDYEQPNKQNFKNSYMHLTNYSLNKNSLHYQNGNDIFSRGSKRCLNVIWQDLSKNGINVPELKQKIIIVLQKYLISMFPFLKYYYHATFPKTKGKCFHVLGLDILVDQSLNPWLLQANNNPSFNIQHEVLLPGKSKQTKQNSPVDHYVKSMVVQDTIYLMNRKMQKLKEMQIGENYYSFKKILDMESDQMKQMNIIENMLKIFHSKCSIRSKQVLTSSLFTKLAQLEGMTNEKIKKNDYHLIYIKIMRQKANPNQMNFEDFIQALEYIAKQIVGYTEDNKLQVMQQFVNGLVGQINQ